MATIRVPKIRDARIRQEGTRVLLILDGRLVFDVDWSTADQIGRGLLVKARAAEEIAKAEAIATDQAILFRAGAPIGLTNHPAIRQLAGTLAAWDSRLRRYLPGGIKSREMMGTPAVIRHEGGS